MIFRSSVWLGFPGFIANISVVNGTDVWPSTFCVGSAVGTEIIPPFFCSQLRVPPQGVSVRKTAASKRKCGCESEPGYDGFSLCHTPASAFMPPSARLGQGGQGVDGAVRCVWGCRAARSLWSWEFCGIHSAQECQESGVQNQGRGAIRIEATPKGLWTTVWVCGGTAPQPQWLCCTGSTRLSVHLLCQKLQPVWWQQGPPGTSNLSSSD